MENFTAEERVQLEALREALAETLEKQKVNATIGINGLLQIACAVACQCEVPTSTLIQILESWAHGLSESRARCT